MATPALKKLSAFNVTALALGLAFLYLPMVILVIYSFNASRLVTVWGGWSLRWYTEFFNDRTMLDAAWMSLRSILPSTASLSSKRGQITCQSVGSDKSGIPWRSPQRIMKSPSPNRKHAWKFLAHVAPYCPRCALPNKRLKLTARVD